MTNGPSKQDLESYWQNSRQYFDELAKYYQTADPEYYRQYMQPFYDNPFRSVGKNSGSKGGGGRIIVFLFAVLLLVGIGTAGLFLFMGKSGSVKKKIEEMTGDNKVTEQTTTKEKTVTGENTEPTEVEPEDPSGMSDEDNFIIGAKYIGEKKYDKAAWHLKQIKPGDKRYKEAQQLLESIKYLKKFDK